MKHLEYYQTTSQQTEDINNEKIKQPYVFYTEENNTITYNINPHIIE